MLGDKLIKVTGAVAAAIKETQEYHDFTQQKKLVKSDPEIKHLIEHARSVQVRLMDIPEDQRNSDYAESLQDEYEEITENTAVYEYLRAESVYISLIQEVLGTVIENIDIDIDF